MASKRISKVRRHACPSACMHRRLDASAQLTYVGSESASLHVCYLLGLRCAVALMLRAAVPESEPAFVRHTRGRLAWAELTRVKLCACRS